MYIARLTWCCVKLAESISNKDIFDDKYTCWLGFIFHYLTFPRLMASTVFL